MNVGFFMQEGRFWLPKGHTERFFINLAIFLSGWWLGVRLIERKGLYCWLRVNCVA
jgi:hypothetical protein